MKKTSFKHGVLKFLQELANGSGKDLIYSVALEKEQVFICVAAHPSMTKKRFDTENERLLFLINPSEYVKSQEDIIQEIIANINEHTYLVNDNEDT